MLLSGIAGVSSVFSSTVSKTDDVGVKSPLEIIVNPRLHIIKSAATTAVAFVIKFPAVLENIMFSCETPIPKPEDLFKTIDFIKKKAKNYKVLYGGSVNPKNILSAFFSFSLIFGSIEFIRGIILTGFPWNLFVYSFSENLNFISIISIIGTYSLNLIVISFFYFTCFIYLKKN